MWELPQAPGAFKGPKTCSASWVSVPVCLWNLFISPPIALSCSLWPLTYPSSYTACAHMGLNPVIVEIKMISLGKKIIWCDSARTFGVQYQRSVRLMCARDVIINPLTARYKSTCLRLFVCVCVCCRRQEVVCWDAEQTADGGGRLPPLRALWRHRGVHSPQRSRRKQQRYESSHSCHRHLGHSQRREGACDWHVTC